MNSLKQFQMSIVCTSISVGSQVCVRMDAIFEFVFMFSFIFQYLEQFLVIIPVRKYLYIDSDIIRILQGVFL